jgi:nicotinamidase-related amidase
MKEAFFTPENIDDVAAKLTAEFPPRGHLEFVPERSALLVVDMQRCFIEPDSHSFVPSSGVIIPRIVSLVDAFESAGRPIVLTRHLNTGDDAGLMDEWWGAIIRPGDPGSAMVADLERRGLVVEKSRYDAFIGTGLEEILRTQGVEQVVVAGVMTHLCCESTARSAFMRDLGVFFTVDGTATYNRDLHEGSLRALAHGFAVPVTVGDIVRRMAE